jgi:hypothetical protein
MMQHVFSQVRTKFLSTYDHSVTNKCKLLKAEAMGHERTAASVRVVERRTPEWKSKCIRRVARPAETIRLSRGFPYVLKQVLSLLPTQPTSKFHCSPPKISHKISAQKQSSQSYQNFIVQPYKYKIQPKCSNSFL